MRAMILAAGLGTRLRPLTDELPKPLVPVGDRPMLAHVAERLAAAGLAEAVINTHHLAAAFTPELLASLALPIRVVHEPLILGTAGGITHAAPMLGGGDVVLWNGDILADLDLRALIAQHRARAPAATLAVAPRSNGEGTVGIGAGGRVVRLRGERYGEETASADFIGVQVMSPTLRAALPLSGGWIEHAYQPALRRGEEITTFETTSSWEDIGTIPAYLAANRRWLARTGRGSYAHPTARVAADVELRGSVIGAGAEVTGAGVLDGVVVWPGARAAAPLSHRVVTARSS